MEQVEQVMDTWEERTRNWIKKLFGESQEKKIKELQSYVDAANTFAARFEKATEG